MDVLIVGAGEMGRWFGTVVASESDVLAFLDVEAEAAAAAVEAVEGGVVAADVDVEVFDLVCIAVPLSAAEAAIHEHAERCGAAMVDVSGAMAGPIAAMRSAIPDRERLSLHPLFSASNAPGNVATVADRTGPTTERVRELLVAGGNTLVSTTPEEHDRAMETVQAKVHAAVLAYALAADDVPPGLETPVSAGMQELVEAVTGGTPRVYAEIQERFEGAAAIAETAERIAGADRETFERLYREAGSRGR